MRSLNENPELKKRLLGYSATASLVAAAGLGFNAQRAAANPIVVASPNTTIGAGQTFGIDFDGNLINEFTIFIHANSFYADMRSFNQSVSFLGQPGGFSFLPYALNQGDPVSATAPGSWDAPANYATLTTSSGTVGYWLNLTGMHYVGIRYVNSGDSLVHYGWVELTVVDSSPGPVAITIHRYGHDTTAGTGIPSMVALADAQASSSSLAAVGAAVFTALAGLFTWLRLRLGRKSA